MGFVSSTFVKNEAYELHRLFSDIGKTLLVYRSRDHVYVINISLHSGESLRFLYSQEYLNPMHAEEYVSHFLKEMKNMAYDDAYQRYFFEPVRTLTDADKEVLEAFHVLCILMYNVDSDIYLKIFEYMRIHMCTLQGAIKASMTYKIDSNTQMRYHLKGVV